MQTSDFYSNIQSVIVLYYSKNAKTFFKLSIIFTSEKCVINKNFKPEGRRSDA
jgi:hypothetical protein